MKLQLTEIERGWFRGPADDVIVLNGTTFGFYQVTWNGVPVGSVHLFSVGAVWHAYDADGELIESDDPAPGSDPVRAAVAVCHEYAKTEAAQ